MNGTTASGQLQRSACAECARLQSDLISSLENFAELAIMQLEAFQFDDTTGFARLNEELELAGHEKARRIAALAKHRSEPHRAALAR